MATLSGAERRHAIWQQAHSEGRVSVPDLAETFAVTAETIRRDLATLDADGLVRRVHGGAVSVDALIFEPALEERQHQMTQEKIRIGAKAAEMLPTTGAILIDAGSTTAQLADRLPPSCNLTIATNSLPIAATLAQKPNVSLLMIGGRIRGRTQAAVDYWALKNLESLRVDVSFVAANAVSVTHGLETPDSSEATVKRAIIDAAKRVVLLVDHTKFEARSLLSYANLSEIDTIVTGNELDEQTVAAVRETGVDLVLV